jgi:hypothetical protein
MRARTGDALSTSFIERAEAAMRGVKDPSASVELFPVLAPPVLDAQGRRALVAPLLAAFVWTAAFFREGLSHPLDPLALLLRLLALALSVRALLLFVLIGRRVRLYLRRGRYQLALCDEGFLLRTPEVDFAVRKEDVVEVSERGSWQEHAGARFGDVYVVTRPDSGRLYTALPPLFARTPGMLAEALMRWRGAAPAPAEVAPREPAALASKLFDAVDAGEPPEGTAVIEPGNDTLRRGPFATVLLGIALLDGMLRMPAAARLALGRTPMLVLGVCLLLVPGMWLVTNLRARTRKGAAMLLTPAELLFRTRGGVQRVRWAELGRPRIESRTTWSVLLGPHETRTLVLTEKNGDAMRYAESSLAPPAEVVAALCEGYRKGLLP